MVEASERARLDRRTARAVWWPPGLPSTAKMVRSSAMKLGEMLVRDGRISAQQLEEALAQQARGGGRVGTVMVEMDMIDVDTLTVYLGLELGIPIATRATLDRAKRSAVRLLTPEQAARFRCVPIVVQDRRLIAAVDDPHDLQTLDELSQLTGYRVIPRVAPELRIFHYLELYYGVPRPARYARVLDIPDPRQGALPAPPLPGLPPPSANPVPVKPMAPIKRSAVEAAHEALRDEADMLASQLELDSSEEAEEAPPADSTPRPARLDTLDEFASDQHIQALDMDEAIAAISEAQQRGDVADALMSYAVTLFDVCALCIVRDNMAFGWKASGPYLDRDRIETLLVPLEASSIFSMALHNDNFFHDAPPPGTLQNYLYRVLRCAPPDTATVAVISISKRVVNLLYGHRIDRPALDPDELENLRLVCNAVSRAYVRLIAQSKRASTDPGEE